MHIFRGNERIAVTVHGGEGIFGESCCRPFSWLALFYLLFGFIACCFVDPSPIGVGLIVFKALLLLCLILFS